MSFIDTHCHLNLEVFDQTVIEVVDRSLKAGVERIIVPGIDLPTSIKAIDLSRRFDCVYAAVGIHPSESVNFSNDSLNQIDSLLSQKKVIAVGEIGLDYFHHQDTKGLQINLLQGMLNLAVKHKKPVILHSRDSLQDLLNIIPEYFRLHTSNYFGVLHAFEGNIEQAKCVNKMPLLLGIGGPVTYKNGIEKQRIIEEFGITNVILETDSPYLSPHPFRGTINEPSRIPLIAQKIAEITKRSVDYVENITTQNAMKLFNWDE